MMHALTFQMEMQTKQMTSRETEMATHTKKKRKTICTNRREKSNAFVSFILHENEVMQ